ncbi:deoxyribose-phosphate aldolase [Simiduia aestuariiviva]|uniref:Deoxyribose-phosphate aldolase n=1 Tax=Simiduia aestuariiviva TaxID=1510459 RepID=A0A839UVK6_9GAMM|nr:deoxyribose-phosphate aldolase [Simiduia aestuariiviva]MBB3169498.1 deoxyribose-phosphate aldolase [Simiduia aestuariiviva]
MTAVKKKTAAASAKKRSNVVAPLFASRAIAERNPGTEFNARWLTDIAINQSAVERRIATLKGRRSVKKAWQSAWLLRAISCIDLTTLSGDDTPGRVKRLCAKARNPVRADIIDALGAQSLNVTTGAVCVYHVMVEEAVAALAGSGIPVAAVSTGFPACMAPIETRLAEIRASVAAGAAEIDIVISRRYVLNQQWDKLYDEVRAYREACGDARMKTIISTGQLATLTNVAKASMVCMMAGADFIKTSTGMESVNATLPVSLVMVRMIRKYFELTGFKVGFKPAGGISKAKDALDYLVMIKEELGVGWLNAALYRFGASSLLGDIERQLEHQVTGCYSASHRHPLA